MRLAHPPARPHIRRLPEHGHDHPARREHLQRFRQARPRQSVRDALKRLEDAAVSSANLVPAVIGAVEGQATLGEIADTLRRVYGVYQENVVC